MSQAQRKLEQTDRARSVPPPLPRRSHGGPAMASSVPSIKPHVTPPPPPAAAFRSSRPPRLSVPPAPAAEHSVQLALLPQWEDANAPLRPAPKQSNRLLYWIGSATASLAVGAMVAAGLMSVRPGDLAQFLPRAHSEQPVVRQLAETAPLPPIAAVEHSPEIQPEVAAVAQPVLIDELTVTSEPRGKASKANKRAKSVTRSTRRAQAPALTTSQPDPRDEAEAEEPAQEAAPAEPEAAAAPETPAPAAAPEAPVVSEPEAPALPEKLTRDQVRSGLDAMRSQVLQCANGTYGRVLADVTISAPGRVSHAVIEGTFAGTNAGSCMARALRGAQFPAFSGPDISVRYPFSF